jgi:hypothetical protein
MTKACEEGGVVYRKGAMRRGKTLENELVWLAVWTPEYDSPTSSRGLGPVYAGGEHSPTGRKEGCIVRWRAVWIPSTPSRLLAIICGVTIWWRWRTATPAAPCTVAALAASALLIIVVPTPSRRAP